MAAPKGKGRKVDASRFSMVPRTDLPRSAFDVTHTHKTTFGAGYLIPVYVDEVLPGDSIRVNMHTFCRLATPIVPVMDNLYLESFFFFVPNRLLWANWEAFMGEKYTPSSTTEYVLPQRTLDSFNKLQTGSLADYMGVQTQNHGLGRVVSVNALPFRAYNLIWNEWFRDQDLQQPVVVQQADGPDTIDSEVELLRRGKRHDYFTSARPWPQKPMNSALPPTDAVVPSWAIGHRPEAGVPVMGIGTAPNQVSGFNMNLEYTGGRVENNIPGYFASDASQVRVRAAGDGRGPDVRVLINDIRTANVIQLMMERNARGGTRYAEIIRSHFGVTSPDARLQRPEYLGGNRSMINVNPVTQTSASGLTGSTTVLGEQAGVGTAAMSGNAFSQSFTEHGIILGLVCVRADQTYQQGIERMWWRRTQFDFYWPSLAHLGEQAILSRELYHDANAAAGDNELVFGYQERWAEYKYKPNRVSGLMRSTEPSGTPIDFWHFGQEFVGRPVLGDTFIQENPPVDRVLQTTATHFEEFLMDASFDVRYVRPMPMFSIPGLGPRF